MELKTALALVNTPQLITDTKQVWADLGAGTGFFTQALARYLQPGSTIIAVDKGKIDLEKIPTPKGMNLQTIKADFTDSDLKLEALTGILMANSLHYVKDKTAFIKNIERSFAGKGSFLIIEYDTEQANPWVPYPISFSSLKELFIKAGYPSVEKINETPSAYGPRNIYAAWIQ
jgi:ubiquinone/menaquinone biosynthesis C-methylase UbiE